MTNETLMTETAATTNEGQAASDTTAQSATGAEGQGQQQQAPEGQQAAEGNADTGKTEGAKPEGAPESYDWGETQLDSAVLTAFGDVAKELNLTQDAAKAVLDKMTPVMQARQAEQIEAARTEWAEQSKADKEFGGEKLQENLGFAKKAMDQFATPELKTLLNESGLGNHPEVIRFFVKAGKAISEDKVVTGAQGTATESYNPKRLYPNSNMN